jgi:hypothetical protein
MLAPGKFGQDFLLHGRKARGSAYEAFVALLQAIERLLRGVVGMMLAGHDSRSPCRSAMGTRIVADAILAAHGRPL